MNNRTIRTKKPKKDNKVTTTNIQAGEISDRILNPLTTIKGFLELNKHYELDSILLNLLLKEIKEIEDSVVSFEDRIKNSKTRT
ncbi:MAG: hypothetical protein ACOYVD_15920 [Bacillota bacterium]